MSPRPPVVITLDASQERAVELACSSQLGLITGGPGRGKTTCLKFALDLLDERRESYVLAAPTGKAAKRMNETTGRHARTIHRLLEFSPRSGWARNERNPIDESCVIVDESSMIDVELGARLLAAIRPERTRLILIGDADQLPPVGPGRVFGDLVDAGNVPTVRLDTLHRSARESWIFRNAPRVLAGDMPELSPCKDFMWVPVDAASDILPAVQRLVCEVLPEYAGAGDVQTLIPQRPGVAGINAANKALQNALNPYQSDLPRIARGDDGDELRLDDRVIQTKNDYTLGVFNGEVGEIQTIAGGNVTVDLSGDRSVTYTLEQANSLQLAYALTVHRAQGSEFPWVVVVCHSTHAFILSRQLLYTAITRGKQGVVLVGNEAGLKHALGDAHPPKRNTGLIERMRGEI